MHGDFLLDPEVAYLSHGSFGACTRAVFDEYQRLQRELEREPTDFLTRRLAEWFWDDGASRPGLLADARAALAAFVGAKAEDLVYVPNATSGLNAVIRSLRLGPGDEVLTTGHEYGAIVRTWQFAGAALIACEPGELAARIGPATRAVSLSHVTSPTALVFPVESICTAAREARESDAMRSVQEVRGPCSGMTYEWVPALARSSLACSGTAGEKTVSPRNTIGPPLARRRRT